MFGRFAAAVALQAGRPWAFLAAIACVLVWVAAGFVVGFTGTLYQLSINTGTTIITFLMVFLIQSSQNRDTLAIQAKLDELLKAIPQARTELRDADLLTEPELQELREAQREEDQA